MVSHVAVGEFGLSKNADSHERFSIISPTAKLGRLAIVDADCVVGPETVVGDFCKLKAGSRLGSRVVFDDYANTSGAVVIGDDVCVKRQACVTQGLIAEHKSFIGPGVMVIHEKHVTWQRPGVAKVSEGVRIGCGAVVGGAALLMPGVDIGHNAWVASGALVTKHCEPYGIYAGRPARKIGEVSEKYRIRPVGQPLRFEQEILERYLPDLVRVGKYEVR